MEALLGWRGRSSVQTATRRENQRSIIRFVARPSGRSPGTLAAALGRASRTAAGDALRAPPVLVIAARMRQGGRRGSTAEGWDYEEVADARSGCGCARDTRRCFGLDDHAGHEWT